MLFDITARSRDAHIVQTAGKSISVTSKVTELLHRRLPGDTEVSTTPPRPPPPVIHPTPTFKYPVMEKNTMVMIDDEESRPSLPKLCINDVEVNLITYDDQIMRRTATAIESHSGVMAKSSTPESMESMTPTISTSSSEFAESIFGSLPVVAPLFLTAPRSPALPPLPLPTINSSSITPIAASVSTAPIEVRGFIEPIFGSDLSEQGFGMFYTPSTIPRKREGSPLQREDGKVQAAVPPRQTTADIIAEIMEAQYAAITPPPSPILSKVNPLRFPGTTLATNGPENITTSITASPDPSLSTISPRYHEYDFRSLKIKVGTHYMGNDRTWVLDHAPHLLVRTVENSIALLHPGRYTKFKAPRAKKGPSSSPPKDKPKYNPALDIRAKRGTPIIALIRSLTTVPDSAFHPVTGTLRKEWLGEARPQLFFPDGAMQDYLQIKNLPAGFDYPFFGWLRGDQIENYFDKEEVQRIVCRCLAEVAREERVFASYGVRR